MAGYVESGGRRTATDEINARAAQAAAGFQAMGIGPGDGVALYLRNDFAFFEASFAAGLVGAYSVPVNWHYTVDEARYLFANSGAKAIVIHADLLRGIEAALPAGVPVLVVETAPEIATAYGLHPDQCAVLEGATAWAAWLEGFAPLPPSDIAAPGTMIYTSGTTGRPKGVRRTAPTPEQALAVANSLARVFGLSEEVSAPEDIVTVQTGPLYHSAPNAYGLGMVRMGAQVILQPRFDAEELLALIEARAVTHLHMVPTMFVRLLKLPDDVRAKYDLSSLKFVVHAAAPCPVHTKEQMIDWWGPVIHEYYGGTETSAVVFCTTAEWLAHRGTVGKALPSARVLVLDDEGQELEQGATGEIVCRLTSAPDFTYHGDDAKRARTEKHGLISLGDIGYLDEDGFLYLCDRASDMVISGGVNIYPAEIEAELHKMPGVADCAVFGIPDEEFGESLCAVVQPSAGAELTQTEVVDFLRGQVAGYKVPRQVNFQNDLPREDSGKIFKRKLRDPYWQAAGRQI